jgi:hypothetical protein
MVIQLECCNLASFLEKLSCASLHTFLSAQFNQPVNCSCFLDESIGGVGVQPRDS